MFGKGLVILGLFLASFCFWIPAFAGENIRFACGRRGSTHYEVANTLGSTWKTQYGFTFINDTTTDGSYENCLKLLSREADLALAQSDVAIELLRNNNDAQGIRAITALYDQVFFLVYKKGTKFSSLKELVNGKRVGVSQKKSGTYFTTREIFKHFGISDTDYVPVYINDTKKMLGDEVDIICTVTGFNNKKLDRLLNHQKGELFSFDNPELLNHGSSIEGFCLNYPLASPYVIPKQVYSQMPENPVLTISVKNVLLARADLDIFRVYDLISCIYLHKENLIQLNPIFQGLPASSDNHLVGFQLHEGAKLFYTRDEPNFLERYAEIIGTLVSLLLVLFGLIPVGVNYLQSRKREKIITKYYKSVLNINAILDSKTDLKQIMVFQNDLDRFEKELFELVVQHKLITDTAFTTLITFLQNSMEKIQDAADRQNPKIKS